MHVVHVAVVAVVSVVGVVEGSERWRDKMVAVGVGKTFKKRAQRGSGVDLFELVRDVIPTERQIPPCGLPEKAVLRNIGLPWRRTYRHDPEPSRGPPSQARSRRADKIAVIVVENNQTERDLKRHAWATWNAVGAEDAFVQPADGRGRRRLKLLQPTPVMSAIWQA